MATAPPASADEPRPIPVAITSRGQMWSIGAHTGAPCSPTCQLHVKPGKHVIEVGGVKEEMLLDGPTEITYSPGSPKLHTVAGWVAIGGVGAGGVVTGFAIWGLVKACATSQGCPSLTPTRTTAEVLVVTAGVLITISVIGAITYAVTGESLRARDMDPPEPGAPRATSRAFDVLLSPSLRGASLGVVARF